MKKKRTNKNNKKSGGKFLEGALVGTILSIVAGMLLAPKSGKKMRKDIMELYGDFYYYIAPQVKNLKRMGGEQYNALMAQGVKSYAKARRLSHAEEKMLAAETRRSSKRITKHLR